MSFPATREIPDGQLVGTKSQMADPQFMPLGLLPKGLQPWGENAGPNQQGGRIVDTARTVGDVDGRWGP